MAWSKTAISYFAERAIDPDIASALGVRENGHGLEFPYPGAQGEQFSRSRALNGTGPKMRQPTGQRLTPWTPCGIDGVALICEGESDLLSVASVLYEVIDLGDNDDDDDDVFLSRCRDLPPPLQNVVPLAIPGAGAAHEAVAKLLQKELIDAYIVLDGDDAGRRAAGKLKAAIDATGPMTPASVVELPDGSDLADRLAAIEPGERADWLANVLLDAEPATEDQTAGEEATTGPAPTDVEVREVLDAIHGFLSRFLVMSDDGLRVLALWVFHTWAFEAAETTPYLSIRSPERESGKTRVIEVVSLITRSSEQVADASISALFRSIEKFRSTLLFDEVDGIFRGRDEDSKDLKRLLNSGYRTGATVLRTVGEQHEPKRFSTFSPKLLAGLGGLPDTLESRCVPILMHRRLPDEQAERLRVRVVRPEAEALAERLADVAYRCIAILEGAFPEIPDELGDRAADCAEPLLAIADYAGDSWPVLARKSLVALQGGRSIEDESTSTRLLVDIRAVFGERDRISSRDLLEGLHELEEAPWGDWFGKPLSAAKLNRLLHDFSIHSRVVRFGDKTLKGFQVEQFEDSWARYVQSEGKQGHNPHSAAENGESEGVTEPAVLPPEKGRNPAPQAGCDVVTPVSPKPPDQETLGAAWDRLERARGARGTDR